MGEQEERSGLTFEEWLGYEFIGWFAYGVLSGLIAIFGWENFVAGAVALAGVVVIGMISWAISSTW